MTIPRPPKVRRGCPRCGATPVPGGGPEGGATIHGKGCPAGGRFGIR